MFNFNPTDLLCFSILVYLPDGLFIIAYTKPSGWTHFVLNYIAPNRGEGIRIFYNGAEVASGTTKSEGSYSTGDGKIVVGRFDTINDEHYASVYVDELIIFNRSLSSVEISTMYNALA